MSPPQLQGEKMANTTATEIANKTLFLLKVDEEIADLPTSTTTNGKLLKMLFYDSVDTLLEIHPWNFAAARAELAVSPTTPEYEYTYQFQLPTNPYCLKVLEVVDSSGNEVSDWVVEGRYILCNVDEIKIRYTKKVTVYSELSSLFRETLAYYLASQIAEPLTRSTEIEERMLKGYEYFMKKARRSDSQQGTYEGPDANKFTWYSRRYGSYNNRADKNYR